MVNDAVNGVKHGLHANNATSNYSSRTNAASYGGGGSYGGQTSTQQYSTAVVSHTSGQGQNIRKISEVVKGGEFVLPANAYEQSRRQVSSVVIFEEQDRVPDKPVRYVEVPQYEEVVKHVTIKEVREVEKVVPKIVEEWIERIVEVPQIEEVIRHVEVPQIQEVVKHVPKIEIVDRPYDVVKQVSKIEVVRVEKVVELGAEMIEVPKAVPVEERVSVMTNEDRDAMLVVSQKVKPVIVDGAKEVVVDVVEYEPEVMPVDIHVAKFVEQELVMMGAKETIHRVVTVPAAQYNSMLRFLNIHLTDMEIQNLPYLQDVSGQVSFLPQEYEWHAPQEGLKIYGYRAGQIWGQGTPVLVQSHASSMSEAQIRSQQAELDRQFQQIFQQFESERTRRVAMIDEFNRAQETKVRNMIGSGSQYGASTGANYYGTQSSISYSGHQSQNKGSIAYQAGHAVGSAINRISH